MGPIEPIEHYEITLVIETPDFENADFVFEQVAHQVRGFEAADLCSLELATIHPTFEGDEIREESN